MPTPATADDFFTLLARSGLLPADALAPYQSRSRNGRPPSPAAVARELMADGLLTGFQARQLLHGRHRGYFLTDKYKVLDLLGEGGMGRVYLCEQLLLHRLMAVKVLHQSVQVPGAVERFLREARAAAALDHPNIAHVYDVDRAAAGPFMVMEYVDGTNLHHLVATAGPLPPARAADYAKQAADGLHHAHLAGLIHRDVKPGNLMAGRDGVVKLLDLGLARFFDSRKNDNLTSRFDPTNVLGTADFIAPEQTTDSSNVDIRADLYSLGATLYYLLTGRFPFPTGTPVEKLVAHQKAEPAPIRELNPRVPEGLAGVVAVLMRKTPADRFQTPAEASRALALWAAAPAPPPADQMPRSRPEDYRLGLAPPPSAAGLGTGGPQTPASPPDTPPRSSIPPILTPPAQPGLSGLKTGPYTPPTVPPRSPPPPTTAPPPTDRPTRRRVLAVAAGTALTTGVSAWRVFRRYAGVAPTGVVLHAGGSTAAAPLLEQWAAEYQRRSGTRLDYTAVGSAHGVDGVLHRLLDFAVSEAPLTDSQMAAAGGRVVHVPLALQAVVPAYNLPDAGAEPLRFTGPALAGIFLGKITHWNAAELKQANPGRELPDRPIVVVHRRDGSGTTYVWTDYLSRVDAEWQATVGRGSAVRWPVGVAAEKSSGVADAVSRTAGAIGYVEHGAAVANRLPAGRVKNRAGEFVAATVDSIAAAFRETPTPADLRFSLADAPGAAAYPVVGTCWAVALLDQPADRGATTARFLRWATGDGQALLAGSTYAPFPVELGPAVAEAIGRIR
ncbi:MAG: phosphate ABC transporter substrate-binding protein PstS [Gemmataceae bacterium]